MGSFFLCPSFGGVFGAGKASAATYYIDGAPSGNCAGGSGTSYRVAERDCGGSDGTISWVTGNAAFATGIIARGDTIYYRAGTYQEQGSDATAWATGDGASQVTITPYNGETATINIKAGATRAFYLRSYTTWSGVGTMFFTNTDSVNGHFFQSGTAKSSVYFDRIDVDHSKDGTTGYQFLNQSGDVAWTDFKITRSKFHNMDIIFAQDATTASANRDTITLAANEIDVFYRVIDGSKLITLNAYNNTIVRGTSQAFSVAGTGGNHVVNINNNIFVGSTSNTNARFFILLSAGAASNLIANASNWNVSNNILWQADAMDTWNSASLEWLYTTSELMPMDKSNKFIDPAFTAYGAGPADSTLILSASSNAKARGLTVSSLFSGNDADNAAWQGEDVGCYSNPDNIITTPTLTAKKVAWVGDSSMLGVGATSYSSPTNRGSNVPDVQFAALVPELTVVGGQGRAISGLDVTGCNLLIDYVALTDAPETIVLGIGGNNLVPPKTNQTAAQLATEIVTIMDKIEAWGIRPIWLGIGSRTGADAAAVDTNNAHATTGSTTVNNLIEPDCDTNGWSYDSKIDRMKFNSNWKDAGVYFDCLYTNADGAGCTASNHANDDGYAIYASLAENLYYNRNSYYIADTAFGTATPTATAPATYQQPITLAGFNVLPDLYGGQSGRVIEISGNANLTITPVNLNTTDQSQKMNIEISAWQNTGNYHKQWIESSDILGNTATLHTVGDLEPNTAYKIKIDDIQATDSNMTGTNCTGGVCTSEGNGQITFIYTGGYSAHIFDVELNPDNTNEIINTQEENNERDLNTSKIKAISTPDSITIEWKTDYKTRSTLRYGTNRNLSEKKKDNDKEKKHKMTIANLLPNTKYYFKIKSEDGDDNEDRSKIHSIKTKPAVSSKTADQDLNANQDPQEAAATSQYSGTATPKICSYTVEAGDSLWNIANEVYGTPTAYPQIVEKNKDKYPNIISVLSIGQELTFDCQNSGDVQETSEVKEDNKPETEPIQIQESIEASEAKWWNPFSWF